MYISDGFVNFLNSDEESIRYIYTLYCSNMTVLSSKLHAIIVSLANKIFINYIIIYMNLSKYTILISNVRDFLLQLWSLYFIDKNVNTEK